MSNSVKIGLISLAVIAAGLVIIQIILGSSTIDIALHDTYYVINRKIIVFVIAFLFFLAASILTRFRTYWFWLPLFLLLLWAIYWLLRFWNQ